MGQSLSSPLDLYLAHWKDVQATANNQRAEIHKGKFVTFAGQNGPLLVLTGGKF